MVTVYSDKKRKPRYWVSQRKRGVEEVLFESDLASEALQWAIDHYNDIGIAGEMELKNGDRIVGKEVRKKK